MLSEARNQSNILLNIANLLPIACIFDISCLSLQQITQNNGKARSLSRVKHLRYYDMKSIPKKEMYWLICLTVVFFAHIVIAQIFWDYIPLIMIVIIAFAILTTKLLVASKKKESKYWKWYALSLPLLLLLLIGDTIMYNYAINIGVITNPWFGLFWYIWIIILYTIKNASYIQQRQRIFPCPSAHV